MYPRSFFCEEAKIKQRTPLNNELCEIGEEAIWESRFTSFLFQVQVFKKVILKIVSLAPFYTKIIIIFISIA